MDGRASNGTWKLVLGGLAGWAATMLASGWHAPMQAAAPPASGSGGETIAVVSDPASGAQTVYVLDPKQKAFSVYVYDARKEKLRLAAARHFAADHQLSEYNNEQPSVADIERLTRER